MRKILSAAAIAATLAVTALTTPATAGHGYQPDGLIRLANQKYRGDGVYNDTGAGQTSRERIPEGGEAVFILKVENDGELDGFWVDGCAGNRKFGVKYFKPDGTNISAQVKNGTYQTPNKFPGNGTIVGDLVIKARARAEPGDKKPCKVEFESLNSLSNPEETDVVKGIAKVI